MIDLETNVLYSFYANIFISLFLIPFSLLFVVVFYLRLKISSVTLLNNRIPIIYNVKLTSSSDHIKNSELCHNFAEPAIIFKSIPF